MCMLDTIHAKRDEIYAIARRHKAERLWVFGSVARREERPDSDVDFLVEFRDDAGLFSQVRLIDALRDLFSRKVDVVSSGCVDEDDSVFSREVRREMVSV